MDAGETHFGKSLVLLRHTIQNLAMIVRQGSTHRPDVDTKGVVASQFGAKRTAKTESLC